MCTASERHRDLAERWQGADRGRRHNTASCTGCATDTAELYDPKTASFTPTANLHGKRRGHSATLLADGRVLIAGGIDDTTGEVLDTTEIYNPAAGTFSAGPKMHCARFNHIAGMLTGGKVLLAGGFDATSGMTNSAELYDPTTGRFTVTGSMTDARAGAGAASFTGATARSSASR